MTDWEYYYDRILGDSDTPGVWYTHEVDLAGDVAVDAPCPTCEQRPLIVLETGTVQCTECEDLFHMSLHLDVLNGTMTSVGKLTPLKEDP